MPVARPGGSIPVIGYNTDASGECWDTENPALEEVGRSLRGLSKAAGGKSVAHVLAMVAALLLLTVAGCVFMPGSSGDSQVELDISMREAQHRIYGYFNDTLREFPASVHLSNRPDNERLGFRDNNRALAIPCWDGSIQTEGPRQISIGYWVVGIPSGETRNYFARMVQMWQGRGWETSFAKETSVALRNRQGFGLKITDAGKGDGSLSLTGFSPGVPEETMGTLEEIPEVFPHP